MTNSSSRSDLAFTPSVKAEQEKRGSRNAYARMTERHDWSNKVGGGLAEFIQARDSFYLATATAEGQPYIQHKGGPTGFLRILGPSELGFADFSGNQQYISLGNLAENDKAYIFLMDYENQRRVKIWGRVRMVEGDEELLEKLTHPEYAAQPERAILFTIEAWSANCNQHIPRKYGEDTVARAMQNLTERISTLENEAAELRAALAEAKKTNA